MCGCHYSMKTCEPDLLLSFERLVDLYQNNWVSVKRGVGVRAGAVYFLYLFSIILFFILSIQFRVFSSLFLAFVPMNIQLSGKSQTVASSNNSLNKNNDALQ